MKLLIRAFCLLTLMSLSLNSHAAGASLFDLLLNQSAVKGAMDDLGLLNKERRIVQDSLKSALVSLNQGRNVPSKAKLRTLLIKLQKSASAEDKKIVRELNALLNSSSSKMSGDQLVEVANKVVYLSERYGKGNKAILACVECVSEALRSKGFLFSLRVIKDPSKKAALSRVPSNPRDLKQYLQRNLSSKDFGSGSYNQSAKMLGPEEERTLGLFVELAKSGTAAQRNYAKAVLAFSKNAQGETVLINDENPHLFWKILSEDIGDAELKEWADMLNEVTALSKGKTDKKDAFIDYLYKRAGNDPLKKENADKIASQNCFFRK